jgi:hypothetical protein
MLLVSVQIYCGRLDLLLNRESLHGLIVGRLGIYERESRIDFQTLSALMLGIGLNERIINPLFFQPSKQKVPPFVGGHGAGNPGFGRIPGKHLADTAICISVLACRLKEVDRPLMPHTLHMEGEQLTKGMRVGDLTILAALSLRYANRASFKIDFCHPNCHQFADPNPRIEERLNQDHMREVPAVPDRLIKTADFLLCRYLWQPDFAFGNQDLQFFSQRSENAFEIGIIRPFGPQILRQFSRFFLRWGPGGGHVCLCWLLVISARSIRPLRAPSHFSRSLPIP